MCGNRFRQLKQNFIRFRFLNLTSTLGPGIQIKPPGYLTQVISHLPDLPSCRWVQTFPPRIPRTNRNGQSCARNGIAIPPGFFPLCWSAHRSRHDWGRTDYYLSWDAPQHPSPIHPSPNSHIIFTSLFPFIIGRLDVFSSPS